MVRVFKLYIRPCREASRLALTGQHLGFSVGGGEVRHLFKVPKAANRRLRGRRNDRCGVFRSNRCVLLRLMQEYYVNSISFHGGRISATIVVEGNRRSAASIVRGMGGCVESIEELNPADVYFTGREAELASMLVRLGYFDYPRSTTASRLAEIAGMSKSGLAYVIRRIVRKSVARSV